MKLKSALLFGIIILFALLVRASDFSPQGNINGRNINNITSFIKVTGSNLCLNISGTETCISDWSSVNSSSAGSGGNSTEQMQDAVGSGFQDGLYYNDSDNTFILNTTYVDSIDNVNSTSDVQQVPVGGEVSGTVGSIVLSNSALDDQYLESDAANIIGGNFDMNSYNISNVTKIAYTNGTSDLVQEYWNGSCWIKSFSWGAIDAWCPS